MKHEIKLQRDYYTRKASQYEQMHVQGDGEHDLACMLVAGLASHYNLLTILDVGSGTGRAVIRLSKHFHRADVLGIEPVEALRAIGHSNGIPKDKLIDGDATKIAFNNQSFDLVMELGMLHHVPYPHLVIAEMLRVSRRAIFISDINRFGRGGWLSKQTKLSLWRIGLWPLFNWLKTKGKRYHFGEGDGVAYSYSVFDDYTYIKNQCSQVIIFNLDGSGMNALTGAHHIGLFAIK
jgi:ubiquinone/menaquinone biosynthesis C-methylase UbiE